MKNKKKLIAFVVLSLFCVAGINAVLVTYLSNSISADVEVLSPMVLKISTSDTGGWLESLSLSDMYTGGADTFTFYTKETNIASESVTGDIENIVVSSGITCDDFDSVMVSTKDGSNPNSVYGAEYDLIPNGCVQDGYNRVKFIFPISPLTWSAGQIDINRITVTFEDVIGTYTFTSQIIPQ